MVEAYFQDVKAAKESPTVTGLTLHLGFASRQSFYDYENRDEFSYTIKRARLRVECEYEKKLSGGKIAIGAIFALKNFGWTDRQEIKHEGIPPTDQITKVEIIKTPFNENPRGEES